MTGCIRIGPTIATLIIFISLMTTSRLCFSQARAEPKPAEPNSGFAGEEGILRRDPMEFRDMIGLERTLEGNNKLIGHYERQEAFRSLSSQLKWDKAPRGLSHGEFRALLLARLNALLVAGRCEDNCDSRGEAIVAFIATSKKLDELSNYSESSLKGLAWLLATLSYELQTINPATLADGRWVDEKVNGVVREFLRYIHSQTTPDEFIRVFLTQCLT